MSGRVFLVGAGPGHPGLLTLRGRELLESADVVLYDALANPALLEWVPSSAEVLLVGKRHGRDEVAQEEIEALLIDRAGQGLRVVRLKGGDPFLFGRGGEEAEACRRNGIDFEVVPGVTSAIAVPAFAGIPVTHRRLASSVTIVTGASGPGREDSTDWEALARTGGTLVVLMGMTRLAEIASRLIAAGMAASTPAAAIRWGSLARQRSVSAPLADIAERAAAELVRPPVVLVIGAVAGLADTLDWYRRLPLFGRRIAVTRAAHQAGSMAKLLGAQGAEVVAYPTIEIEALPVSAGDLDACAGADWLVLTSANGADRFFDAFLEERDIRDLAGVRIAAIGPVTAERVRSRGLRVDAVPDEFRAEALAEVFGEVAGRRVVLARAERAREILPATLTERGAQVRVVPLYRTVTPATTGAFSDLDPVDAITFTSASTAENFNSINGGKAAALLDGVCVAAIGPITAAALEDCGVRVSVVAERYTTEGLTDALVGSLANRDPAP